MYKKYFSIFFFIVAIFSLSGCFLKTIDDIEESGRKAKYVEKTELRDSIIAIGKSKLPISGYENAIILAGKKSSYMVETKDLQNLQKLLDFDDLSAMRIYPNDMYLQESRYFVVRTGEQYPCQGINACSMINVVYSKESNSPLTKEENILAKSDFHCQSYRTVEEKYGLRCTYSPTVKITIISSVVNEQFLKHKFSKPLELRFFNYEPKNGENKRLIYNVLSPIAITLDIITFPIQSPFLDIKK